jgi:DNA polymerase III subunit chi
MTQIDFHILSETNLDARYLYCCRLVEKIASLNHKILIVVDNQTQAAEMDDLLWSFKPESFIPHQLIGGEESVNVEISFNSEALGDHQDVLIILSQNIPQRFSRFSRVCEIVVQENNVLNATREHYKFYKERGYPIQQHKR